MVTKEQATKLSCGQELHYTGQRGPCRIYTGPHGGKTETITRVRVSGSCKTWKRDPERFRLPVKYGLYESSAVEAHNSDDFHLPEDCMPVELKKKTEKAQSTRSARPYYPDHGIV